MLKLALLVNRSGCDYWRSYQPAWTMAEKGLAEVRFIEARQLTSKKVGSALKWCDAVVARGLCGTDGLALMTEYQRHDRKVFIDYDDFFFDVSPFNPAYRHFGLEEVQAKNEETGQVDYLWQDGVDGFDIRRNEIKYHAFIDIVRNVDLLTCTTPYLKQKFAEIRGTEEGIEIVPNALNWKRWRPFPNARDHYQDGFRFGWAVSDSHGADLLFVRETIKKFLENHKDAKFVLIGDTHVDISKYFPKEQLEWHAFSNLFEGHYAVKMGTLGLDVAIAPLADLEFNRCKSPLKYAEYTAFGWPIIAQKMLPYDDVIIHGETGLLAGSPDEWYAALEQMYQSKELRSRCHFGASMLCKELFDLEKVSWAWAAAYKKALGQTTIIGAK